METIDYAFQNWPDWLTDVSSLVKSFKKYSGSDAAFNMQSKFSKKYTKKKVQNVGLEV